MPPQKTIRVAVVYHFFAHYRSAIMRALMNSKEIEYVLVSDRLEPDKTIEPWQPPQERWLRTSCVSFAANLLWQRGLLKLALRRDLDVIIYLGNVNFLSTWCSALVARISGKRVLFWTHGWIRDEQGVKGQVRNYFYRLAHGLLLYGKRAKLIGIKNGFHQDILYVVYNSLDYEMQVAARSKVTPGRIRQVRSMYFPRSDSPILICTSRLTRLRELDLLLSAMTLLQKQSLHTCLILVGDGPERDHLTRMVTDLSLTVHFYGPCYDEFRLAELIMSANLTIAPGKVGLTAMHSLVYGTPVITHDDLDNQMPESEAIEPGQTGDFFKRGDANDLARVIQKWLALPWPDENIRKRCMSVIECCYNPNFQRRVINRAVAGLPPE